MSDIDPETPGVTEVRTTYDPATATTTQVRREVRSGGGNTGWWLALMVALVAILAGAYLLRERAAPPAPDQGVAAATAQGAAQQAAVDAQTAAATAQANAQASAQSTQAAIQQSTQAAVQTDAARAAADRMAAESAATRAAVNADRASRGAIDARSAADIGAAPGKITSIADLLAHRGEGPYEHQAKERSPGTACNYARSRRRRGRRPEVSGERVDDEFAQHQSQRRRDERDQNDVAP